MKIKIKTAKASSGKMKVTCRNLQGKPAFSPRLACPASGTGSPTSKIKISPRIGNPAKFESYRNSLSLKNKVISSSVHQFKLVWG